MIKVKGARVKVTLECFDCRLGKSQGVSRYLTSKNRRNTNKKLVLLKYCKYCNKPTSHKEIK